MSRLFKTLLLVAMMVSLTGSQWGLLQGVAWMGMIADRLETRSLEDALSSTFSGLEPCALCEAIEEGKSKESQKTTSKKCETKTLLFSEGADGFVPREPQLIAIWPVSRPHWERLRPPPQVPPPDLA